MMAQQNAAKRCLTGRLFMGLCRLRRPLRTAWQVSPSDLGNGGRQAMISDVIVTLEQSGLPFGANKATPQKLSYYPFRHEPKDYGVFWDTRKGLIPIVGGAREVGECLR